MGQVVEFKEFKNTTYIAVDLEHDLNRHGYCEQLVTHD